MYFSHSLISLVEARCSLPTLLPTLEVPDGLQQFFQGQPIAILHGLTKLVTETFFSLTASLSSCVRHWVWGLSEHLASQTLHPQLKQSTTKETKNMFHSNSMFLASL